MFLFIVFIILAVIALIAVATAFFSEDYRPPAIITALVAAVGAGIALFFATFYANGVGEAKVMVNSVDRTIVGTVEEPGSGFKAPWVDFVDFDLFSQELVYAGGNGEAPSYTGGSISGAEVTVTVGGLNGGSTQANVDIAATYSVDASAIKDIYSDYREQTRFTKQIVEKTFLSVTRTTPSQYSAIEFRGEKRAEAAEKILDAVNEKLNPYGVTFEFVNIQDVRFSENVENALQEVEVANQKEQAALADQRAKQVEADTKVIQAEGEAEANRVLTESLTDQVLEQRRIEALRVAAEKGNLIIDGSGGSGVLIQQK